MTTLIFDIETDGFYDATTRLHCLVVKNTETNQVFQYHGDTLEEGLRSLMVEGVYIAGHNVIKFDIPVIQKLYPWFQVPRRMVVDTLVLSRLIYSDLKERDGANIQRGVLPNKLFASHSLKAWGYRLGIHKGEYGEQENAFDVFTPEMLEYCTQDVEVTHTLYSHLTNIEYSQAAIEGEHEIAYICGLMERSGWPFDEKAAWELLGKLRDAHTKIKMEMEASFEPTIIGYKTKPKSGAYYTAEELKEQEGLTVPEAMLAEGFKTYKLEPFNPASRDQIATRLINKYGWKPKQFTPAGKPQIDEDILKALPYPEAKTLAEYFLLEKRLGQLHDGKQGWLAVMKEGHLHGSINTNGAVTGRCTHQSPNLAQVPSVRAVWGAECRRLFTVRDGFRMVGADLSGLELRCLGHFMARWDDGEYAREVLEGDVHTRNQQAAGLPTRGDAKTFIYAFLYGAGDEKIGSIIGKGKSAGAAMKQKFLKAVPALRQLKDAVTEASKRGYLIGLDGRRIPVRSQHAALNSLLQGAGALISKRWVVECFMESQRRGYQYGWDGQFTMLGYIHDEIQFAVREELAEDFGKMVIECARRAGEHYNFKCPIDAEYKIGMNWYDTH